MIIDDLSFLEEVTQSPNIVGGKRKGHRLGSLLGSFNVNRPQTNIVSLTQVSVASATSGGSGGINIGSPAIAISFNIANIFIFNR